MNNFNARNASSMVADLDGWSFQPESRSYAPPKSYYIQNNSSSITNNTDFGFDPPTTSSRSTPSIDNHSCPLSAASVDGLPNWSGLSTDPRRASFERKYDEPSMLKKFPYAASAVSRNGQITPPRSNSAVSSANSRASVEQESQPARRKCTTKIEIKTEESPKTEAATPARRRKAGRKSTKAPTRPNTTPEDDKRKKSLEKNRLAAAKCRINKKEKTDQLQLDSHDKAVENTFLKQTVMQMREEIQQLQTTLMSHSSSDHCKSPESIHEALGAAGSDNFTSQMANNQFLSMQQQETTMRQLVGMHGDYFQSREIPALPEFKFSAEFEVCTPMLED
jgi:bZIP transcription factor